MAGGRFDGQSILIVEDEPLVALELRQTFEDEGAFVFAATQLSHALALAQHPDLSLALLDYRLGDATSATICRSLESRNIPFLFYSGYDEMLKDWPGTLLVSKPASRQAILDAAARLSAKQHDGALTASCSSGASLAQPSGM